MTRKEKVLSLIIKDGHGIEIGPSYSPFAPKKEGYKVHIIDHMTRTELLNKYKDYHVNLDNIEEVDFVWKGEKYSDLTGKKKYYDWIIASHVVEHIPDLISFFKDCDAILKDDGVISLAIPDKRYCFDHYRPITGISKIIDNYYQNIRIHTPGTAAEFYLNVVSKAGNIAWDADTDGACNLCHSLDDALEKMNMVLDEARYVDLHAWCFVPHSFRLLMEDLFALGFIPFREAVFYPTEGCEFFVTLSRQGKGPGIPRLEMLQLIESELCEGVSAPPKPVTPAPKRRHLFRRLFRRLC